jgi:hypothetical protein
MKRSNHYGDIKIWIEKIISSCVSVEQLYTTGKMINRFEKTIYAKYPKMKHSGMYIDIIKPLQNLAKEKYKSLKKIK